MFMLLSLLLFHFLQVASTFGDVSSVLGECMDSVSQCEGLQTLLQYHKDLSLLDHNGKPLLLLTPFITHGFSLVDL